MTLTGLIVVTLSCSVPGALNSDVTQDTIAETICSHGWTDTVRSSSSVTNVIKRKLLGKRYSAARMKAYELDHCEPLELGGHPSNPNNLWLQPWTGRCGAKAKDRLETRLKRQVCSGAISLETARIRVKQWCL